MPYSDGDGKHIEHFPVITDSRLVLDNNPRLIGTLRNGERAEFNNRVFHGGVGFTLEYRIFLFHSLGKEILAAGFTNFRLNRNAKIFGITWENWSRVWVCG